MTTSVEIQSNQNNSVSSESQSQQVVQDSSQRKENPNASTNPTRTETFEWLQAHNYPPLPVAPAQDPHKYPKTNKKGEIEWSKEKDVPVPRFTGKNPSYLDKNGIPHTVNHHHYQNEHPTQKDLDLWFANDLNGIGTLGGWNNTVWLDFDVKQFESSAKCEKAAVECVGQIRTLTNQMPFLEQTHSGGWRVGVRVKQKPNFTNFALTPGGHHVGEALGKGRFTVLAPTIGPSGNPYTSINRVPLPEIESLEQIGIYPKSLAVEKKRVRESQAQSLPLSLGNGIRLEDLGNEPSRQVLRGDDIKGDRSDSLTGAIKEWFGWDNWCDRNNIHPVGTPENLAHQAADRLGIDEDRVGRILKTIDIPSCQPAAYHKGGDESCWKKIWKLDRASFEANCPEVIRERIKSDFQESSHKSSGQGSNQIVEGNKSGNNQPAPLTIRDVVAKAEEIISTEPDSLLQKIKLEELRQQTGISSYEWNAEYINLIRSKLERQLAQDSRKEQRRQALLAIACEKDPDEREDLIVTLCRNYGWRRQYVESRIDSLKAEEIKPKAKRMTFEEFMDAESEPIKWIYPGLIPKLGVTLFSGDAGAGKSSATTDLAASFVTGDEFLGEVPVVPGRVLYFIADEPDGFVRERLMHRLPLIECPQFELIPNWDVLQMDLMVESIKHFKPDLVVVDSYNAIHLTDPNYDENSPKAGRTIRTFDALSQTYGCGFVVIHHNGKGEAAKGVHKVRGSTDIPAAASTVMLFEKCANGVNRQIKIEKTRAGTGNRTLTVGFDESTKRVVVVNTDAEDKETKSLSQHILEFLKKNEGTFFEQCEVQRKLQLNNNNSAYSALKRLADRAQIIRRPSRKINAGKRSLIYGIPSTVTHPQSEGDTHPQVSVRVHDLEAETYIQQEFDKSCTDSSSKSFINHAHDLADECQNSSNADSVDNSVNHALNMTEGGVCPESCISVTVESDTLGSVKATELEQIDSTSGDELKEEIIPDHWEEDKKPNVEIEKSPTKGENALATNFVADAEVALIQSAIADHQRSDEQNQVESTNSFTPLEQLIDCLAGVSTKEEFEAVTAGQPIGIIQDAIVYQDTQIKRQYLRALMNLR
jgi:hypothetical protein